jgi:hypothetical protein
LAESNQRKPSFASVLAGVSDEERKLIIGRLHPAYAENVDSWRVQQDAFEGRGGFLDGDYLWPYPREAAEDFASRRSMARYHNYLETLVDLYVRFIFTSGVSRSSNNQEFNEWQENVDGAGTKYNELLKRYASAALVNGHSGLLIDKTQDEASGPTKADERARVIASIFTAPTIIDWRFLRNSLVAVKLTEASSPAPLLSVEEPNVSRQNYLIWDREGWARFDEEGRLLSSDTPGLGVVPFVVLRPKPSQINQMLGRALVSNANVIRALFNRASEEDEVLRAQAFSVLTISVDKDANVDDVRASIGNAVGTAKAIVVKGQVEYKTPSQDVPGTIRDNIAYLVQEMYRAAHMKFKRDTLAVESGDAIRLQYTELNEMLQGFAKALAQAELEIARAWFAWQNSTPEAGESAFQAADIQVGYPNEFFLDALVSDLEAWSEALRMNLGVTMSKRIKKRAVRRIDPQIPPKELEAIDAEIDAQEEDDLNPDLIPTKYELDNGNPDQEDGTSKRPDAAPEDSGIETTGTSEEDGE